MDIVIPGNGKYFRNQFSVISMAHIRETGSQLVIIAADKRVVLHQVYMILDDHEVTDFERWVYPAAGIGYDQEMDPEKFHHTYGKCDLLHGITFIIMKTPLHGNNVFSAHFPEDKLPVVAVDCGNREIWNRGIGNGVKNFNLIDKAAQ